VDLQLRLGALCAELPDALGAVLCDYDGERVVSADGAAEIPEAALAAAARHVPRTLDAPDERRRFLLSIAGAEPCGPLAALGAVAERSGVGALSELGWTFRDVAVLVATLPDDYYLVLALRRPTVIAPAWRALRAAARDLAAELA
jgi:hypothetical protein